MDREPTDELTLAIDIANLLYTSIIDYKNIIGLQAKARGAVLSFLVSFMEKDGRYILLYYMLKGFKPSCTEVELPLTSVLLRFNLV